MSAVSLPTNRASYELLIVTNPGLVTSLEFIEGYIIEDELPDFRNYLHQALQSFESLECISFEDSRSSLYFKDVLNIITSRDNITLLELRIYGVTWECFEEVSKSWQRVFANLKILYIAFGDEFEDYTSECVSGLKRVLGWASNVEELHCEAYWDLFWDDIAIDVVLPSLKHLVLKSCKVTESFLKGFLDNHLDIEHLDMCANIFREKEDEMPMEARETARMFCSPLFNGINGEISQDKFERTWGDAILKISHKHVKYQPKRGRAEIFPKEWQ